MRLRVCVCVCECKCINVRRVSRPDEAEESFLKSAANARAKWMRCQSVGGREIERGGTGVLPLIYRYITLWFCFICMFIVCSLFTCFLLFVFLIIVSFLFDLILKLRQLLQLTINGLFCSSSSMYAYVCVCVWCILYICMYCIYICVCIEIGFDVLLSVSVCLESSCHFLD